MNMVCIHVSIVVVVVVAALYSDTHTYKFVHIEFRARVCLHSVSPVINFTIN